MELARFRWVSRSTTLADTIRSRRHQIAASKPGKPLGILEVKPELRSEGLLRNRSAWPVKTDTVLFIVSLL